MFHYFKVSIIAIITIAVLCFIWGFFIEPGLITQRNIEIKNWKNAPLKIAFVSDIHAGAPHINRKYILQLVAKINEQSPDLILLGGDLLINGVVGGHHMSIEDLAPLLAKFKSRLGTYAVLGNHDWWNDGENIRRVLEKYNIAVLENQAKFIKPDAEAGFWLVGIGDESTNHARAYDALNKVTSNDPVIAFMHDPAALLAVKKSFFLALAGHLHGGQVSIPFVGAIVTSGKAPRNWANGFVNLENGNLFVTKGVGTSLLPVRFNAVPEFVILNLVQ
jgi:predicted MPP superfamily phosphohydrolase